MTIKVYRENEAVFIYTAVANFQQKNIVERTAKAKSVSAAVLETLQYKTAIHAKNEFEAYLNSTFANSGEVVQEAKLVPPPPPRPPIELPVWLKPDVQFETAWVNFPFSIIPSSFSLAPQAFIIEWPVTIFNFYVFGQMGIPFDKKTAATGRIAAGYLLRYNEYFHMPVDIGLSFGGYKGIEVGFTIGAGVMKLWEIARFLSIYTAVKINIGTDVKNPLNNTLMLSVGFLCDFDDLRIE
jgi:hypothetical protein